MTRFLRFSFFEKLRGRIPSQAKEVNLDVIMVFGERKYDVHLPLRA
jgi:hypothetical protein